MALTARTVQFITQLGLLTYVDPSTGPQGPEGTTVYKLVPTSCWSGGSPFPREVQVELKTAGFSTFTNEGIEYFMVPDETSTNVPGLISYYARTTAPGDLLNPPGGGVNRAAETFVDKNATDHVVQADAVSKYVKSNDNWDDAYASQVALDARVKRQVGQEDDGIVPTPVADETPVEEPVIEAPVVEDAPVVDSDTKVDSDSESV